MALHIDCSTCPAKPRACVDCSIGFLLGPVVAVAPGPDVPAGEDEAASEPDLNVAIAQFAGAGMLPHLRAVPEQGRRAG